MFFKIEWDTFENEWMIYEEHKPDSDRVGVVKVDEYCLPQTVVSPYALIWAITPNFDTPLQALEWAYDQMVEVNKNRLN